ncbi:MAG: hypothetical protein AAF658_08680 [Myxococcota bacterium]
MGRFEGHNWPHALESDTLAIVNVADIFVLVFAGLLMLVTGRLVETSRNAQTRPSRAEILARFNHQPQRLWLSVGTLALADAALFGLAFAAFGAGDEPLFGIGAHGWVMGVTLVATCALVTVVLITVIRVYLGSED